MRSFRAARTSSSSSDTDARRAQRPAGSISGSALTPRAGSLFSRCIPPTSGARSICLRRRENSGSVRRFPVAPGNRHGRRQNHRIRGDEADCGFPNGVAYVTVTPGDFYGTGKKGFGGRTYLLTRRHVGRGGGLGRGTGEPGIQGKSGGQRSRFLPKDGPAVVGARFLADQSRHPCPPSVSQKITLRGGTGVSSNTWPSCSSPGFTWNSGYANASWLTAWCYADRVIGVDMDPNVRRSCRFPESLAVRLREHGGFCNHEILRKNY